MPTNHPFLSRRALLKSTAAVVAGTVLLPQLTEAPSFAGSSRVALKVGAVVPHAQHFPALGRDLTSGLSLALAGTGGSINLHSVQYDSSFADAYNAAEMLLKDGAHVIVATVGNKGSEMLSDLCARAERPLIITNTGEHAVRDVARQPFTFYSTLNTWQASYALGQWAVSQYGKRGMIAASYYDSGYDTLYAFEAGFTQAGGEIVYTTITHSPANDGFGSVYEGVATYQPDFVYALYTDSRAQAFLKNSLTLGVPILGSPFLTETAPYADVHSATAWTPSLQSTHNDTFVKAYTTATGLTPSVLSVLGWDTGAWIAAAFKNAGSANGIGLQATLRTAALTSPRGTLRSDAASQSLNGPVYLRRADGYSHQILSELALSQTPLFTDMDGMSSGSIYPYLA